MSMNRTDSRGREAKVSTGRGGVGNVLRSPSRPREAYGAEPNVIAGSERGRSIHPTISHTPSASPSAVPSGLHHTGRGGVGNTRSPSTTGRKEVEREEQLEEKLVAERRGREGVVSTGRGGAGNLHNSRSRSRQRSVPPTGDHPPTAHESALHHLFHGSKKHAIDEESSVGSRASTNGDLSQVSTRHSYVGGGRGGYGNIIPHDQMTPEQRAKFEADNQNEAEILQRWRSGQAGDLHSSGRGGTGNLAPPLETDFENLAVTTEEEREARDKVQLENARNGKLHGHGGVGNYTPPSSGGRGRGGAAGGLTVEDDGRGRGGEREGVFRKVMRSLSRHSGGNSTNSSPRGDHRS